MKERLLAARLDGLIASKDEELELARQLIVDAVS
jgi:tRNA nucleotidyltransferase (CCA-adding enzyme)